MINDAPGPPERVIDEWFVTRDLLSKKEQSGLGVTGWTSFKINVDVPDAYWKRPFHSLYDPSPRPITMNVKRNSSDYNVMIDCNNRSERMLESSLAENLALRQKMEQDGQTIPHHAQNGAIKSLLENLLLQAREQRVSCEAENRIDTSLHLVESFDDSKDMEHQSMDEEHLSKRANQ